MNIYDNQRIYRHSLVDFGLALLVVPGRRLWNNSPEGQAEADNQVYGSSTPVRPTWKTTRDICDSRPRTST
jgi:hypothetical protein